MGKAMRDIDITRKKVIKDIDKVLEDISKPPESVKIDRPLVKRQRKPKKEIKPKEVKEIPELEL
jgi:hypothetical protein